MDDEPRRGRRLIVYVEGTATAVVLAFVVGVGLGLTAAAILEAIGRATGR